MKNKSWLLLLLILPIGYFIFVWWKRRQAAQLANVATTVSNLSLMAGNPFLHA